MAKKKKNMKINDIEKSYISFALMYALDNYPDFFYQSKDIKNIIIGFATKMQEQEEDVEVRMKQAFVSIREDIKKLYEQISDRKYKEVKSGL